MRAGIHAGPLLREADQLYGDVVSIAARMTDIAKRFEIVLTESARQQLSDAGRWNLRLMGKVPIKGQIEPMNIYLLASDEEHVPQRWQVICRENTRAWPERATARAV